MCVRVPMYVRVCECVRACSLASVVSVTRNRLASLIVGLSDGRFTLLLVFLSVVLAR